MPARQTSAIQPRHHPPGVAWLLIAGVLYFVLARFGMAVFALQPANITLIWLPAGIALIMVRRWHLLAFPVIFLASFAANLGGMAHSSVFRQMLHTALGAGVDTLAGYLAARALQHSLPEGLRRAADIVTFGLRVCLIPMGITSTLLTANLLLGGYIDAGKMPELFFSLLLADSLGLLLTYPLYQAWQSEGRPDASGYRLWLLSTMLVMAALLLDARGMPGAVFFLIPAILAIAVKGSLLGTMLLTTPAMLAVMIMTASGSGSFINNLPEASHTLVLPFVFSSMFALLGVTLQSYALNASEQARHFWMNAAEHDMLTGLLNRRGFWPILRMTLQRRRGRHCTLCILDIDHFKRVNDEHGHDAGDQVLRHVSALLVQDSRSSDTVARIGGEEFAILLPDTSSPAAHKMLEHLRQTIAGQPCELADGSRLGITISIGIAGTDTANDGPDTLLAKADEAMYLAKRQGRNRTVSHEQPD